MRLVAALVLAILPGAAAGQQVVVSPAPEEVSVSVYGNPKRPVDDRIELSWLGGYALITETRTVVLPAGESELRFEGVAGTIIPSSVIIRGLPGMPAEKNYDARLLSAGSLIEAALGRQVHIRRTSKATGKVTESEAIIRSGPDGIVLQTAAGFEALQCTDLAETLVYREVPPGLSARPTLSVRAAASAPTRATLSLSYLAGQFDWQANYVARMAPDGKTLDLFAWLTLANGNNESFPQAQVNAIAGKPNRDEDNDDDSGTYAPSVNLNCWPAGRTSDPIWPAAPPPPAPPPLVYAEGDSMIVVTGSRMPRENLAMAAPVTAMTAQQEELGDLKLYRIPEAVTVAANAQKQVALLHKERVKVDRIYQLRINSRSDTDSPQPVPLTLRTHNNKASGLGLPLPAGSVAVFERAGDREALVGEDPIPDLALDDVVEIEVGESSDVRYTQRLVSRPPSDDDAADRTRREKHEIEISNAKPEKIMVEVGLQLFEEWSIERASARLRLVKGRRTWFAEVPANGRSELSYTLVRPKPRKEKAED